MRITLVIVFFGLLSQLPAQTVPVYESFDKLEKDLLTPSDDSIYVINFWATWCKPCVAELPYFEELYRKKRDEGISVKLVSLDFPGQLESKLIPFLQAHQITAPVVLLNDGNTNVWIDKVDPEWSGALPVTLILQNDVKKSFETTFHSMEDIMEKIESF